MNKLIALVITSLSLIPLISQAHAEVRVNINNSVNSSSSNTSTSNSKTTVKIETNGEVKEFTTEGNESVNWSSEDGKPSVKINQNSVSGNSSGESTPEKNAITPTPQNKDETSTQSAEKTSHEKKPKDQSLFQIILSFFSSLFSQPSS